MASKLVDPDSFAVGDRAQKDKTILSADEKKTTEGTNIPPKDIAALVKGTDALTINKQRGKKKGATQPLGKACASIGAAPGAAGPPLSGFSEEKPPIAKPENKPQPGVSKKSMTNVGKDPQLAKEKAGCKETEANGNLKKNDGAANQLPPSHSISSTHSENMNSSVGKGMGATSTGMNRGSVRDRLIRKMAKRNLDARQKEAESLANEAENLNLERVSKMPVGEKQELFKSLLTSRVRCIHPALCEKLMSMILDCTDGEILRMVKDEGYLVTCMQKAVAKLHHEGYYDRAKDDKVFNPPGGANTSGKLRKK